MNSEYILMCILQVSVMAAQRRRIRTMDCECLNCLAEEFDDNYRSELARYRHKARDHPDFLDVDASDGTASQC
jgi:hypothetical protein